jgi:hypothetical protein
VAFTITTLEPDNAALLLAASQVLDRGGAVLVPSPAPLPTNLLLRQDYGFRASRVVAGPAQLPSGFLPAGLDAGALWAVEERLGLRLTNEAARQRVVAPLSPLVAELSRQAGGLSHIALPVASNRSLLWPALRSLRDRGVPGVLLVNPAPGTDRNSPRGSLTEVQLFDGGEAAIVAVGVQHPVDIAKALAAANIAVGIDGQIRVETLNGRLPEYLRPYDVDGRYYIQGVEDPASVAVTLHDPLAADAS